MQPTFAVFLLLLILCLAPLPFGSVLLRERVVLDITACLALAAAIFTHPQPTRSKAFWPAVIVAGIGLLGFLQSLSWPQSVGQLLAPELMRSWQRTAELLDAPSQRAVLSLAPDISRQVAWHWMAAAAALWAAGLVGERRQIRRSLAVGLLGISTLEVLYGANLWIARSTRIWGIEVSGNPNRLRGTFINPDHLAFLLAIGITCSFAWIWWSLRRALRRGSIEQRLVLTLLPGLCFLVFFAGLIFTGSRAGLIAVTAAVALQGLFLTFFHRRLHVVATAGGAVAFAGIAVTWFGFQGGLGRLLSTSAYEITWNHRIDVYAASWSLWKDHPLTGTGLGTFREAFPRVQPEGLSSTWNHAHSDVLEILVTNGLLGFVLAMLAVFLVGRHFWKLYRTGERSEEKATGLAMLGVVMATFFHSMVDFGLTIPANTFVLAIIIGAALGAPLGKARQPDQGSSGRRRVARPDPKEPVDPKRSVLPTDAAAG